MKTRYLIIGVVTMAVAAAGVLGQWWLGLAGASESQAPPGVPVFEVDPAWPQVPAKWKLGDISSIAIDAKDNVWVLHRPHTLPAEQLAMAAPPIIVFDAAGKFLHAWGGPGSGYEWPEREHGINIDYKGFVWIGGNHCAEDNRGPASRLKPVGDDQVLKFTQEGKFVLQIGKSNQSTGNADTRAFKRMWGAFSNKPVDYAPCPPSNPPFSPEGDGHAQFGTVHAIRVSNDGLVYVADRDNRRVQVFTLDGKFVRQSVRNATPFARNLALSPDPEQRFLYVGGDFIVVLDRKTLDIVGRVNVKGGGHHIATDSKGNIYVAETSSGMQKQVFKGIAPAR